MEVQEVESLKPYLSQIARNKTKNRLQKITWNENYEDEFKTDNKEVGSLDIIITNEKIGVVCESLHKLNSPDKEILNSYFIVNYKLKEIAKLYHLPLSTIKSKVYRGRKNARRSRK